MKISQLLINSLLQQEDIEGLINLGAPSDEYISEAQAIYSALSELESEELTEERIVNLIRLEWAHSFDLSEADIELRTLSIRRIASFILDAQNNV